MTPGDIKALRLRIGETQEGLARLLDVSTSTVAKWEAGAATPTGERALAIQRMMGETPAPLRIAATVSETVGTYNHAIDTWEQERSRCIRDGDSTGLADQMLRVLRTTRSSLRAVSTDD